MRTKIASVENLILSLSKDGGFGAADFPAIVSPAPFRGHEDRRLYVTERSYRLDVLHFALGGT